MDRTVLNITERDMVCEKCGKIFTCFRNDVQNCWCNSITLKKEKELEIKNQFKDCLCRECLTLYERS